MATYAKAIMKAEDNIKKAVNSEKNSITSFESVALYIGKTFISALWFTTVAAFVKKLGDAVYGYLSDLEEVDRKNKQLGIAIGGEMLFKAKDTITQNRRQIL